MYKKKEHIRPIVLALFSVFMLVASAGTTWAHCDTANGPVAGAARKALETNEYDLIAIWVGKDQAKELREKFDQCLAVYQKGGEGKELAEQYFIETAVRLHREAGGMPYTGLKPAKPLPQDIATAEKALETGNLRALTNLLSSELEQKVENWFRKAIEAKKHKDENVEKGQEWVDAYVKYIIYIHGLYKTIQSGPEHGVGHVE